MYALLLVLETILLLPTAYFDPANTASLTQCVPEYKEFGITT